MLCAGCQKKDSTPVEPSSISIDLSNPTEGQVYRKGDTVFVNAVVSYATQLHAYELSITKDTSNTNVFYEYKHVSTDKFTISSYWVDTLASATDLTLKVMVQIDHNGNQRFIKTTLKCQP